MSLHRIIIVDNRFDDYKEERDVLRKLSTKISICRSMDENVVAKSVKDSDAVIVNLAPITENVIEGMSKCKVISRYGVGYDNVDVEAATNRGIWVANVPDYCVEDVSDHAIALLLACIRKIAYKDKKIREGFWNLYKKQPIHRIKGSIIGLVGYGAIARALHRKIAGFGFKKVLAYDPYVSEEIFTKYNVVKVDFESLLKESNYISIHVPLNEKTRGMFDKKEFKKMKDDAIIINTSRGGIINENALIDALKNGEIGYAGLDVFETEPLPKNHPFLRLDNVILSDHTAYYSEESLVELKTKAALNVLEVLRGNSPIYPVNKPTK